MSLKCCIFDFDGTLFDSMFIWDQAGELYLRSQGKTPLEVEKDLLKVLPDNYKKNANHWLVLFGRYICKAQKPDCENCSIAEFCHCTDKRI